MNDNAAILDKIYFELSDFLSKELLANAQVDVTPNVYLDGIEIKLRGFLYGKEVKNLWVEYPSDWWQAVKLRWFPNWLLERYPAKVTRVQYNAKILLPDIHRRMNLPKDEQVIFHTELNKWDKLETKRHNADS